jgi:ketosteroid isomerase-like protein
MKKQMGSIIVWVLIGAILLLSGCTSKEDRRRNELISAVHESSKIFSMHDIEKYMDHYTDDFQWEVVSAPGRLSRSDFFAFLSNRVKKDPSIYHFQDRVLASGDFAFLDGCSFVSKNPDTGISYRICHADIVEFSGLKIKVMTTFSDGSCNDVALGLIEPTLPAPPLPGRRAWPTPESKPTSLQPQDAHEESQARWNRHDLTAMAEMLHQDAKILISPIFDPVGREAFIAWMENLFRAFGDHSIEATRTFDLGDGWIGSEVKMSGANTGPYLGNTATGKPISLRAIYLGHYDADGLMTELRLYFDSKAILDQLGLEPVPVVAKK